jgi:3-oxoacyl-[acyl-carrier protein] reductase
LSNSNFDDLFILKGLFNDGLASKAGTPKKILDLAVFVYLSNSRMIGFQKIAEPLFKYVGIYPGTPIEEVTEETFRKLFDINVLGILLTIKEAVKHFGDKGGVIINVSSVVSNLPMAGTSEYSATKAAMDAITISLSKELSGRNIRINSLLPGSVETEGTHTAGIMGSDFETLLKEKTPLGRIGKPADIAKVAVFLASDESAWIHGEKIAVSGGIYGL